MSLISSSNKAINLDTREGRTAYGVMQKKESLKNHWQPFVDAWGPVKTKIRDNDGVLPHLEYGQTLEKNRIPDIIKAFHLAALSQLKETDTVFEQYITQKPDSQRMVRLAEDHCYKMMMWSLDICLEQGGAAELLGVMKELGTTSRLTPGTVMLKALARLISSERDIKMAGPQIKLLADTLRDWNREDHPWRLSTTAEDAVLEGNNFNTYELDHSIIYGRFGRFLSVAVRQPDSVKDVIEIIKNGINLMYDEPEAWRQMGTGMKDAIKEFKLPIDKFSVPLFEGLPPIFWMGMMLEAKPDSKWKERLMPLLIEKAHDDEKVKEQLCVLVWTSLDSKNIALFESNFKAFSQTHLKTILSNNLSGLWDLDLRYALEGHLKRPYAKWAIKAFESIGPDEGFNGADDEDLADAFEGAIALYQAVELKKEVKEHVRDTQKSTGAPKTKKKTAAPRL